MYLKVLDALKEKKWKQIISENKLQDFLNSFGPESLLKSYFFKNIFSPLGSSHSQLSKNILISMFWQKGAPDTIFSENKWFL